MTAELAIEKRAPTTIEIIQQVLASGGKAAEMAVIVKELVALKQSEERFQWEREERQAKIDFDEALNRCQTAIGRIAPNSKRENDIAWLDYAGLDKVIRPIYSAEGFAISFSEEQASAPNRLNMKATVSRSGIRNEYFKEFPTSPPNGKMSLADAEASAASRVKRYLMLQIFNIAVGIDKDEKAPYGDGMTNDEGADWIAAIEAAVDPVETMEVWTKATAAARKIEDYKAMTIFTEARDKRLKELKRGQK